jgi:hypothetical protein
MIKKNCFGEQEVYHQPSSDETVNLEVSRGKDDISTFFNDRVR